MAPTATSDARETWRANSHISPGKEDRYQTKEPWTSRAHSKQKYNPVHGAKQYSNLSQIDLAIHYTAECDRQHHASKMGRKDPMTRKGNWRGRRMRLAALLRATSPITQARGNSPRRDHVEQRNRMRRALVDRKDPRRRTES